MNDVELLALAQVVARENILLGLTAMGLKLNMDPNTPSLKLLEDELKNRGIDVNRIDNPERESVETPESK